MPASLDGYEQRVLRTELVPALTEQPPPRLLLPASASGCLVRAAGDGPFSGYLFTGTIGYRYGWFNALAQLAIGPLTSDAMIGGLPHSTALTPIDLAVA